MEGLSDGAPAQQEPAQPVVKRLSFWDLHLRNIPESDGNIKDKLKGFCSTLKEIFQLDGLPDPAKSYCYAFEDSFDRVFSGFFQEIPEDGSIKKLHAQMLSGLVFKKIVTGSLYVIVRYCDTGNEKVLYMLRYDNSRNVTDEFLRDKSKHLKVTLSSFNKFVGQYHLVHFPPHTRVMTLGDQHKVDAERKSARHKTGKASAPKKKRAQAGSSDSDAEPDLDEARADAETLRDTPEGKPHKRARLTDGAAGGASAAGESSAAGASAAQAGQNGPPASQTLSEKDKEFLDLANGFHPAIVVQYLEDPETLLKELQKYVNRKRAIDGVLPKDPTHSEVQKDVERFKKKKTQEGFLDTRSRALQAITPDDGRHWPLDQGFDEHVQDYYPSASTEQEDAPQAQAPEGASAEGADASKDKEKLRKPIRYARQLPRPMKEFEPLPDLPYRSLCFQQSSQDKSLLVLLLKKSETCHWEKHFPMRQKPGRDIRFVLVISAELYGKLPQDILESVCLEPRDPRFRGKTHFLLENVDETDAVLEDDWMKQLCKADLPTVLDMCDQKIKERVTVDGRPIHENLAIWVRAVIHAHIMAHNDSVCEAQGKREKRKLKNQAIDEYNKTAPEGQKKRYKVCEDERFNGLKELPPLLDLPDEVELLFIPFIAMLACRATNGRLEHGVGCAACGKDIVNPFTGPLFHDYIKNNTRAAARRMKTTIPRYFLNGLCNCYPVCKTFKKAS